MYRFKSISKRLVSSIILLSMVMTYVLNIPIVFGDSVDKTKIVLVLGSEKFVDPTIEACKELQEKYPLDIKVFSKASLDDSKVVEELKSAIQNSNTLLMENIDENGMKILGPIISKTSKACHIYSVNSSDFSKEYANIDYSKDSELKGYFEKNDIVSMSNLVLYLGELSGIIVKNIQEAKNNVEIKVENKEITSQEIIKEAEVKAENKEIASQETNKEAEVKVENKEITSQEIIKAAEAKLENTEKTKIVLVISSTGPLSSTVEAYKQLKDIYPLDVKIFSALDLNNKENIKNLKSAVENSSVLLMEMVGAEGMTLLDPIISTAPEACHIYSTKGTDFSGKYKNIDYSKDGELGAYFTKGGVENMRRLLLCTAKLGGMKVEEAIDPKTMPTRFIYHPDANDITFDVDKLSKSINGVLSKESDKVNLGLIMNTAHYTVHEAVYKKDSQKGIMALAQEVLKENVVSSKSSENDWEKTFASLIDSKEFINSATDTVNKSIEDGGDNIPVVINAIYNAFYEIKEDSIKVDDLYNAINSTLKSTKNLDDLNLQIKESINTKPAFKGVFENIKAYKAWYKVSKHFNENGSWIGVATTNDTFMNNDIGMHMPLIGELERNNCNVIFTFTDSNKEQLHKDFFIDDGKSIIDVYVPIMGFNYIYGKAQNGVDLFKKLNVPVITPTYSNDLDDWMKNLSGNIKNLYWQVACPEMDGRIEPILMGGTKQIGTDEATGAPIKKNVPLNYNIERLAGRITSWANLKTKKNEDKNIAIVYYNHAGGKDNITASYLNVFESAENTLKALKESGYKIDGDIDIDTLIKIIYEKGRNVGSWAPGEMQKLVDAGAMTIPVEKYLEWYDKLPKKLKDDVEAAWGNPKNFETKDPGNEMIKDGKIIIPGIKMGNIFVGPQPMRGWGDDPSKIAHSGTTPPPHQYIAFYLWLQHEFKADAVIHFGTHGTLEWLPSRALGLGEDDWPDQLIGNMVNINPYIVNNPGEGTQAKRRGYAVTIDHLTPPMIKPELYGDLVIVQDLVVQYLQSTKEGNTERAKQLQQQVIDLVKKNKLEEEIQLDLTNNFYKSAEDLHDYLEGLTEELMPYGLHTLGEAPEGEMFDKMVDSIINYDPVNREGDREKIKKNLSATTQEITSILRALSAEYIEPGPSRDPVRVPDVMPTGRNIVSFDPREIPDKAAWETGKKAADELLEKFKLENGHYPDSVGIVLWSIETMRTRGESVATILRLIGAEPIWDKNGRVTSVKVTPLEELKRPRVDVVVTISGLFRDTFSNTIDVLDDAFRMIAKLDEGNDKNYVKKHYETVRQELIDKGIDEKKADALAGARIFGDAPGTYGTGVAELGDSTSAWNTQGDLLNVYMNRMSFIYGKNVYGEEAKEAFKKALSKVELVTQVIDSLYGTLDNDDVAQYLGGLKLAVKDASGKNPQAYILNTRNADNPQVQTLSQFVATELRSRILNPKWIEGMLKEGLSGSIEIGKEIGHVFLMDATTDVIDDWGWKNIAQTLVLDEKIRSQLDPYVLQSLIGWNMEAAKRDMWKADKETMQKLADTYIKSAVDYGVVCCHHTCANIKLDEYAASFSTLDKETLSKFKDIFAEATNKNLNIEKIKDEKPTIPTNEDKKEDSKDHKKDNNKENTKENKEEKTIITTNQNQQEIKPKEIQKNQEQQTKVDPGQKPQNTQNQTTEAPAKTTIAPNQTVVAAASSEQTKNSIDETQKETKTNKSMNTPGVNKGEVAKPDDSKAKESKPKAKEAQKKEEGNQTGVKAYEITKKEEQKKGKMSSAVSLISIVISLGFVGLIGRGYLKRR